jgi:serine/threonine protein kinase
MVELPEELGDYVIDGVLGRGGSGIVYRGKHKKLPRPAAVKILPAGADYHEACMLAQMKHPNIVEIYEVGEHEGRTFMAMEYICPGSLDKLLKGEKYPDLHEAALLIIRLAEAIHCAHKRNIIHRDLKPANILLRVLDWSDPYRPHSWASRGTLYLPKIGDFGLATPVQVSTDFQPANHDALIVGTPSYMPPEQALGPHPQAAAGPHPLAPTADVYALGAILYEMITGRPPFTGDNKSAILQQVRTERPEPPSTMRPDLSPDLEAICLKSLEKEPEKRYHSAEALAEDLKRFCQDKPVAARPIDIRERASKFAKRWRKWMAAAAAMAAILLLSRFALFARDDSMARVQRKGKLVFATEPNYPPMAFRQLDKIVGFDVDVANELAHVLGLEGAEAYPVEWLWGDIVGKLNNHEEFDVVIATVTQTPERAEQVDFVTYMHLATVLVGKKDLGVKGENDLAGRRIAVQKDTCAYCWAQELIARGIDIKVKDPRPSAADPFDDLDADADLTVAHEPVAHYYANRNPKLEVLTARLGSPVDTDKIGIAFCKQDKELQAAVAKAIEKMHYDGVFKRLNRKWFSARDIPSRASLPSAATPTMHRSRPLRPACEFATWARITSNSTFRGPRMGRWPFSATI